MEHCSKYYSDSVKVMEMQNVEKARNFVKYLADLSAKIIPSRASAGKGRCKCYPELMLEAFKLSCASNDGTPCLLLNDGVLGKLADTCAYMGIDETDAGPPVKKSRKPRSSQMVKQGQD